MPNPLLGIGSAPNDHTGDNLRTMGQKVNRLPNPDSTVNPLSGDYLGTYEQQISLAVADAVATGRKFCWITRPYNPNLVTFNNAVRMIGEGMNPGEFNRPRFQLLAAGGLFLKQRLHSLQLCTLVIQPSFKFGVRSALGFFESLSFQRLVFG